MAQFIAYVYPERGGFRVFIEGLGHVDVPSLDAAEPAAHRLVARSVLASYPDREVRDRPGTTRRIDLELRIVRVAPSRPP
ncbi:MAG: hypothetical protein L3K06_04585 [Thermoplasmata archaeon]|nr:hypothetical protein [Thermoplasmata archaeon]MCI4354622.1 hypothetical protein [Thermoplasmata archaeon]